MGFWDDLLQQGEDLLEDGKRAVGEVVDAGTDAAGDVLNAVGADGMADAVRDFGDSVADQLGATPDEVGLGESDDPKDLIHGEPGQMRDRAGKLDGLASNFEAGANGLRGISVGEFSGEAADAYHQKINTEAPKWDSAASACRAASGALNAFAPVVEAAQQRAAEAIAKWKEGIRQHEGYVEQCKAYDDAVNGGADVLPPRPPDEDPGRKLQNEAVEILNDARRSRNDGAAAAASAFHDAAADAPPEPPAGQRLAANFNDFKDTADMFTSHAAVGLVGAVTDLGRLVRTVDPTNPYNVAHPADYLMNASAVAAGLSNMAAHPDELVKGFIGDGWGSDPGQATGTLLANLIPIGPKGSGITKSILKDAMEGGSRTAARDGAESALRQAPEIRAPRPEAPSATPSAHGATPDAAPTARTHETPATPTPEHGATPSERVAEPAPEPEPRPEPRAETPPETRPEPPRADHTPPPERPEPVDQPTAVDHSPGPEPRSESPSVDRSPESNGSHSSHSDSTSDSPGQHGDSSQASPKDPDGAGPGPRDELPPKDAPLVRELDGEGRPADTDAPTARDHPASPARDEPAPARPGENAPGHTEATRAPTSEAPPVKPDAPEVRNDPTPPRTDSTTTPQSTAPASHAASPASSTPVNPGRVDSPASHGTPKDASPQGVRDAPSAPRESPRSDVTDARAKPSPNATADAPTRPAAATHDKSAATPAQQIEPAALFDTRPGGQPGGGDRVMPSKTDGPGALDRSGHDRGGRDDGGTDDGNDPIDVGQPSNHDVRDAAHDPSASTEPAQKCSDGTEPVDIATGEYYLPAVDVDLPAVLGLRLTRTHKSSYRAGVWLGPSWSCTFDARVVVTDESVTTIDADGTMLSFPPPVGDEPAIARIGRAWSLWSTPAGGYRLQPPQGGPTYHFAPKPHLGGADTAAGVIFLSAITDAHGNRILFTYNDAGEPSGLVHSAGYRVGVDCEGGRIHGYTLATDTTSTVLRRFGYSRGDLTTVTDAVGATTRFDYDQQHRMVGWTDSNGSHYENHYDDHGRVIAQGGVGGVWASTFSYADDPDGGGRTTVHTDAVGAATVYGFDADLRPRAVADPAGRVTRTDFNAARDPLRITDPTGQVTTLSYTADGLPAEVTDRLGHVTSMRYSDTAAGPRPTEIATADGAITTYEYDEVGNRTGMRDPTGGVWRWEYDATGAVSAQIDPLGRRTSYTVDAAGLVVRILDPSGAETLCSYDQFGNPVEIVAPDGASTRMTYDRTGRMTSRTGPDGATDVWTYDGEGNRTSHTNPVGAITRWEYGFYDLPVARIDADGSRTLFAYDKARRLIAVTSPAGSTWTYRYTPDGMLAAQTDFNGATTSYTYDRAGRLASRTNAAGQTLSFTYDAGGRLSSETSSGADFGGEVVDYDHDAVGRTVVAEMSWARIEFGYDTSGRVTAEVVDGRAVQSVFDAAGGLVETLTPSGVRTSLSYDQRGVPDTLTTGGRRCELTTDARGRPTRMQFGTTAIDSAFDTAGHLSGRRVLAGLRDLSVLNLGTGASSTEKVFAGADYAYRPDDTLAEVSAADPTAAPLGTPARYATDVLGRLTSRHGTDGASETTTFDAAQNPTIDADPRVPGWVYDGTLLIDDGRSRYHYDPAGRLTRTVTKRLGRSPDVWRYRWDAWDRLRTVTTPDGVTHHYTYDHAGRRLSKSDGDTTVHFAWSATQLVEQVTTTASSPVVEVTSWTYLPGRYTPHTQTHTTTVESAPSGRDGQLDLNGISTPPAARDDVDRQFYAIITDHIDSPVAVLDPATGTLAGRAQSTMWGDTKWTGTPTPWRYPGQYADDETGLHYNHHRYYHPRTGRYLSPDPLGLNPAPNPHTYPANPSTLIDPLGLNPCEPRHPWSPSHSENRMAEQGRDIQSHHIIQDAAVRQLSGVADRADVRYSHSQAPTVNLEGGSHDRGSQHDLANRAQQATQVPRGTYGAERVVALEALRAAGVPFEVIADSIYRADRYFIDHLGWNFSTPTNPM